MKKQIENKYEITKYSGGLEWNNKKSKAHPRHKMKTYCIGYISKL